MYSGAVLWIAGTTMWLGSYVALVVALLPTATIVLRIFLEESFLRRTLPFYDAYARRVRYRLVPGVF
jgi:protein-S-isoprenylcysteine O-methyltransferase Ste14